MSFPREYRKRYLHERSFLVFEFPGPNEVKRAYLPFLENIEISESQKSNLAEYSLLARPGSLYSYLGAKSRSFNLEFKMTLQHLIDTLGTEGINQRFRQIYTKTDNSDAKKSFLDSVQTKSTDFSYINHAVAHKDKYDSLSTRFIDINTLAINQSIVEKQKAINLMMWWVNLVRSSVLNNSKNTVYGCPIVRITHGPMYNNVPCLVENYSIKIDEAAGQDIDTLLPKRIIVQMSLVEHRVGDFSDFQSTEAIKGDNITGWESIIEENNIDPYNGDVNPLAGENFRIL